MKIKVVITLFFSLFFLSSCGGGGGGNDPVTPPTASELEGTWVSSLCEVQNNGGYTRTFATMSNSNIVIGEAYYFGSNCTNGIDHSQPKFHGKFIIGKSLTLPSDIPVKEVDLVDPASGTTLYDIYNLNNGTLTFGDSDVDVNYDGSTAEKRPQVLSSTEYNTKINQTSLNTELEGTWFGRCTATGNGDYGKVVLTFSSYETTVTATLYNDAVCTESTSSSVEQLKIVIGNTITTPLGGTVTELDIFNQDYSPYGYDIYTINNGRLYVGDDTDPSYDGSTPETRPLELSNSEYYDKTNITNTLPDLQGRWRGACDPDGQGGYTQLATNINADILVLTFSGYSDSSCNMQVFSTASEDIKLVIGNSITTSSGKIANEINFIPSNGDPQFYDIFSIINGKFYTGDSESDINYDGSSVEKRPIALDLVNFMMKVF